MANEFYTLIVVPHAKARFRKFQVSVRFAKWVGGVGATLALLLGAVLVHYTWINVEVGELRRLRSENAALSTKATAYEDNATKLQTKLLNLQNMVMKLGVMAGLERPCPTPRRWRWRPHPPQTVPPSVDRLVHEGDGRPPRADGAVIAHFEFYQDQKVL
jgi:hypothetical protein